MPSRNSDLSLGKFLKVFANAECFSSLLSLWQLEPVSFEEVSSDSLNDELEDDYDPIVLAKFLDFLVDEVNVNRSLLVPYTEDMLAADKDLIAGVALDD